MRSDFRAYLASNPPPPPPRTASLPPVATGPIQVPPPPPPPAPGSDALPPFKRASGIVPERIQLPELIVEGLLHRGCKLVLSGGSKSFKSWCLMHLALCVAQGVPWWGLKTRKGRVLYLNFELIDGFFEMRVVSITRAMGAVLPENLLYWNLRGHCYDLAILGRIIEARLAEFGPFDLIIGDPMYKMLGDLDENSAGDMAKLMNMIEAIGIKTGAATAFGAHFAKGNAAGKDMRDRASGSGVLARDPDVLLGLTRHQAEDAYVVESELRYLPRLPAFVVRWAFPLMQPDESLDPRLLYVPGQTDAPGDAAGPQSFSEADVLACLPDGGAQDTLWRKHVSLKFGRTGPAFYAAKAALLSSGLVVKQGLKYFRSKLQLS